MDIQNILYPRSKFETLRTLYYAAHPIPIREISYRSGLLVGSVQSGLAMLLREKIITRRKLRGRPYFELANSKVQEGLSSLLTVLTSHQLQSEASLLNEKAVSILPVLEERNSLIQHARKALIL